MTFLCNGCGQNRDFDREYGILIIDGKNSLQRFCRICQRPQVGMPDVYFDGKPEENLADDPATGKPRTFASKFEKAAYLKAHGLQEAGDRIHGAPLMLSRTSEEGDKSDKSRHDVKMALKRVKEMGIDNRRQEFLRIQKEGRRYA